jgi:hypothetical protein
MNSTKSRRIPTLFDQFLEFSPMFCGECYFVGHFSALPFFADVFRVEITQQPKCDSDLNALVI